MMPDDRKPDPPDDVALAEDVRRTAYFLWEQDGRPEGRNEEYYLRALDIHRRRRAYEPWLEVPPKVEP